jgi:proline iminopeptidase
VAPTSEIFVPMPDDVRLYVRTVGSGSPLLVIPNGMAMYEDFRYLADRRTMVFYDVRNRGRSETVTDTAKLARGIEQDVDDLDTLRRHFEADRIDLLGHSYIGLMVAVYAMRHPAHVNRVAQIGPTAPDPMKEYPAHLSNSDATLAEVMTRIAQLQNEARPPDPEERCRQFWDILSVIFVADSRDAHKVNWGRCHLDNERNFMKYYLQYLLPSIRAVALTGRDFERATMPVLTIHGTKDRSAPYGGGRDWAAVLPQGRLLTIHNAAHAPWIEAPSAVFDALKTFFDGRWPDAAQPLHPLSGGARSAAVDR